MITEARGETGNGAKFSLFWSANKALCSGRKNRLNLSFGFAELAFGSVRIDFDNPQSKIRNPQFFKVITGYQGKFQATVQSS